MKQFTPTEIRTALLKAADHIEANPGRYSFMACTAPTGVKKACMWGWTGHFLGIEPNDETVYLDVVDKAIGFRWSAATDILRTRHPDDDDSLYDNATKCAAAMREFANLQFPAEAQA